MTLIRLALWLAAAFAALLIGALLYLGFADIGWLRPRIEQVVGTYTGRELHLGDDLELTLLPVPTIRVSQVTFGNAPWGSQPKMLEAASVAARVGLWSLISGPIDVRELTIEGVDLLVERRADGVSNWRLGEPSTDDEPWRPPEDLRVPVVIDHATLRNVTLTLRAPDAKDEVIALTTAELGLDDASHQTATLEGRAWGIDVVLNARAGDLAHLKAGHDVSVSAEGRVGTLDVKVDGQLGAGSQLRVSLLGDDVAPLLKSLQLDAPLAGPVKIDGTLSGLEDGAAADFDADVAGIRVDGTLRLHRDRLEVDLHAPSLAGIGEALAIDGLPDEALKVDGLVKFAGDGYALRDVRAALAGATARLEADIASDGTAATVAFEGPRLSELTSTLPDLPFKANFKGQLADQSVTLDPIDVRVGDSDLKGRVTLATDGSLNASGDLSSTSLDLSPFAQESEDGAPENKDTDEPAASEYVFDDEPLPFDDLDAGRVDLELAVGQFQYDEVQLSDLTATTTLNSGILDSRFGFAAPFGGTIQGRVQLAAADDNGRLAANVEARGLRINLLSGENARGDQIPAVGLIVELEATGRSPRQLASSANGRVVFTQGPGQVENQLVGRLSGDIMAQLFDSLNPFAKKQQYMSLECTVVAVDLEDGIGKVPALLAQADKFKVVGGGRIDLKTEKLDLEFNTKPRKGVGVSANTFVTPFVKLSGTLANPTLGLNEKGVLLQGGAAFLTGGLSFIATAVIDRVSGEVNGCATMLEHVGAPPDANADADR